MNVTDFDYVQGLPNEYINLNAIDAIIDNLLRSGEIKNIFIFVETLPLEGTSNRIYVVPNQDDTYSEYFWYEDEEEWIQIGSTGADLSNYYTKSETDTAISTALDNYYTKTETDTELAEKETKFVEIKPAISNLTIASTEAQIIEAFGGQTVFNNMLTAISNNKGIVITDIDTVMNTITYLPCSYDEYNGLYRFYYNIDNVFYSLNILNSGASWRVTYVTAKRLVDDSSVLTKTNISSYTPTQNYHPATKKYVDDAIATVPPPQFYYWDGATDSTGVAFWNNIADLIGSVDMLILSYATFTDSGVSRSVRFMRTIDKTFTLGNSIDLFAYSNENEFTNSASETAYEAWKVTVNFTKSSDEITAISSVSYTKIIDYKFLRTDNDYSTPYTPLYDGSPATKKYVDDINILDKAHTEIISTSANPADLNDYITSGTYYSSAGSVTTTIQHIPSGVSTAFKLIVEHLHRTDRILQTLIINSANPTIYHRINNGSWGNWYNSVNITANGTSTLNTSYFSTTDNNNYTRFGNVIVIDIRALISANIPNNTVIVTLPFKSKVTINPVGYLGTEYTPSNLAWCYVAKDSDQLKIGSSATSGIGKWLHLHFTYIKID